MLNGILVVNSIFVLVLNAMPRLHVLNHIEVALLHDVVTPTFTVIRLCNNYNCEYVFVLLLISYLSFAQLEVADMDRLIACLLCLLED